jgi:hypothetical protein
MDKEIIYLGKKGPLSINRIFGVKRDFKII